MMSPNKMIKTIKRVGKEYLLHQSLHLRLSLLEKKLVKLEEKGPKLSPIYLVNLKINRVRIKSRIREIFHISHRIV